jgi:hypothetical protein
MARLQIMTQELNLPHPGNSDNTLVYAPVIIGMNVSSGLTLHTCLPILGAMTVCANPKIRFLRHWVKVFIKISENKL